MAQETEDQEQPEGEKRGADLETIMAEIARQAQERGLTPAALDELLEDDDSRGREP